MHSMRAWQAPQPSSSTNVVTSCAQAAFNCPIVTASHSAMKLRLLLLPFICFAVAASAQITFSFVTTANTTAYGYTAGQSYTFVFTTTGIFTNGSGDNFDSTQNIWQEISTSDPQMFATVTGSGLLGVYQRPVTTPSDPYSIVNLTENSPAPDSLSVIAAANDSAVTGLTTLDGGAISAVDATVYQVANFQFPSSAVGLDEYFASYAGTYAISNGSQLRLQVSTATNPTFTVNSVAISAVPEPSTVAAWLGAICLVATAYRRQTQRA